jgi:HK97 gp10 family phage protein
MGAKAIDGFLDLSKQLEKMGKKAANPAVCAKACEAGAEIVTPAAQRIINSSTQKRSGRLAIGVANETDEESAYVGWVKDAFYGRYFETGTKKMGARPHIRPAYEQNKDKIAHAMIGVLQKEMEV